MKNTKSTSKDWIKHSPQSPSNNRIQVVACLEEIQLVMDDTEISPAILVKEQEAQFNSFRAFRKEEEFCHLKSCSLWLITRDKNTSFFHKQYRARLSHNHISEITSMSGKSFKGITHLKQEAKAHFKNLFSEDGFVDSELTS